MPEAAETATPTDVEALRALDRAAWHDLHTSLYPRLLAYASSRLGHEGARDAVGEAMSRAVASVGRYEPRGLGIEAWVFGIMRHVVADAQRSRYRGAGKVLPDWSWQAPQVDDGLIADEESAAVRAAFAQLDPDDRELLELRVVAGLPSDEVATLLGKKPGAVRMAQARALARLRTIMEVPV